MPTDTVEGLLSGGGASAKFSAVGDVVKGVVQSADASQQTEFGSKAPKFWDEAKTQPMMQIVVALTTEERDAEIADDDGTRRLFVKGAMLKAVREAVRAAGARTLEEGGTLAVKYTGDGTPSKPGLNAPKLFSAQYQPPTARVEEAFGLSESDLI